MLKSFSPQENDLFGCFGRARHHEKCSRGNARFGNRPTTLFASLAIGLAAAGTLSSAIAAPPPAPPACRRAVIEGEVHAGQGFEQAFTRELKFGLEPLPSGWIVRILPTDEARGPHDYAELATPPYQSVSPLLISTDWAFRAQDAVAWNPRRFQYAKDKAAFLTMESLQPAVLAGDSASSGKLASLLAVQPQATLTILDARLAPGIADQARMAATVASHLSTTPHSADPSAAPTPLGKVETLRFRVALELSPGAKPVAGAHIESCNAQPTAKVAPASQQTRSRVQR
jgi:hypothetical protein